MIRHINTILCEHAVVDCETNNVTIQNIIEMIEVSGEPITNGFLHLNFEIVSFWEREDLDIPVQGKMRLSFETPIGEIPGIFDGDIDLLEDKTTRTKFKFESMPVEEPGRHYFHIDLHESQSDTWKRVASIPVMITFILDNEDDISNNKDT